MANSDSPMGLRPVGHLLGLSWSDKVRPYYVAASYATALFIGDPVVKVAAGSNTAALSVPGIGTLPPGTAPQVEKATVGGGNAVTGVIVGFAADPDNLKLIYRPASTERVAFVCDDPMVIFEIQSDGALAGGGVTGVGLNANLIYTHTGSTGSGLSGAELNSATVAVTQNFQLKILRAVNREDNDVTTANAKFEVLINQHSLAANTVGV